ncbi:MAG TPA: hypothetical protein VK066_17735 [Chloroflexota bacterium]|nr:hypothetical protein [Chloroflexota bacterium]
MSSEIGPDSIGPDWALEQARRNAEHARTLAAWRQEVAAGYGVAPREGAAQPPSWRARLLGKLRTLLMLGKP